MPRSDAENIAIIDGLRPEWEEMRSRKIRIEAEEQRLAQELTDLNKEAEETLGTSDVAKIRAAVTETWEKNTSATDEFAAAMQAVREGMAKLDASAVNPNGR